MEEIGAMTELPVGDSRRAHLEECPRCQGLAKSFVAFMAPVDVPVEADIADANTRLSAALTREIGGEAGGSIVRPATFRQRFLGMRSLTAAAAVVAVALGLSLMRGGPAAPPLEPILRGAGDELAPFRCEVSVVAGQEYRLSWATVAAGTTYRVEVYGEGLEELAAYDVGDALSFALQPPVGAAFCVVIALAGGDEVMRSQPAYLPGK